MIKNKWIKRCVLYLVDKFKVLVILAGSIIIILFSFYSFGELLSYTSTPKAGTQVLPINNSSYNQNVDLTENTNTKSIQFVTYKNLQTVENYYSLKLPNYVKVLQGNKPGSYISNLPNGILTIRLMNIPDDSNPALFFPTHVKPDIDSDLKGYHKISLKQLTINGNRAWDLTYIWKNSTTDMESTKTWIEGPDDAAIITYSGPKPNFIDNSIINSTLINPILNSFQWIEK